MLIEVLFVIYKNGKQLKCPLVEKTKSVFYCMSSYTLTIESMCYNEVLGNLLQMQLVGENSLEGP